MMDSPKVSIIVPCYNEEKYIVPCLDSLISNDYPKEKVEIIVIDGMSDDNGRKILQEYSRKYSYIRVLDNPQRYTPYAFNLGIANSTGEVVMIASAHARYEYGYVSKCAAYLEKYSADNVGGRMMVVPRNNTFMAKAIAAVLSSPFGVGNSIFRIGSRRPKWVDTVLGGCYKKTVFTKIGLFNPGLIRSQDIEFNLRLKKAGLKTLFVPDIKCYYYARSDMRSFITHNFRNGLWAMLPFKYTKIIPISFRHAVPLLFVLSVMILCVLQFWFIEARLFFFLVLILYLLSALTFSLCMALKERDIRYVMTAPLVFLSLHVSYGLGSLVGAFMCLASKEFWVRHFAKHAKTLV